MGAKISFRHNVIAINSIDMFLNLRGGINNNLRDVYFVRGIGEPNDLPRMINTVDKRMGTEMANHRLRYTRINILPMLRDRKDSDYYSGVYDQWKSGKSLHMQKIKAEGLFGDVLGDALAVVSRCFSASRKSTSETMIRNFATKLLFWLDHTAADVFEQWSERACIKVIADNVVKDQEYLFYLMLTFLGCDVMLLQNRCDTEVSAELKKYSCELHLGIFGMAEVGRYSKYVPPKESAQKPPTAPGHQNMTERPAVVQICRDAVKKPEPVRQSAPPAGSMEKSFEELAQLASSVVMIAVHNRKGEVIGTGSGIMLGRNGYILTNNHVASGGRFYSVRIEEDEEVYTTDEVIKYHSTIDLAVIRIRRQLEPIPIYRQKKQLIRGQKVIAIGSPLGLFNSVSDGIISGFRKINGVDMIQFTAPISPGSSGGAVLNMQGEVIGISTAGMDRGQNINLAIGYESILMFAGGFLDSAR